MGSPDFVSDLTSIQEVLTDVWTEVLGVEAALGDDFFALGGDSIAAVQMVHHLSQLVGTEVPPTLIYAYTTLDEFAVEVDGLLSESRQTKDTAIDSS